MSGVLTAPALPTLSPATLPVVQTPEQLQMALLGADSVGLVPTMGSLHDGHAALIERARAENSLVVVSIFVNPLQFGPGEDLSQYPRDLEHDRRLAQAAGADLIFHPSEHAMYPAGFSSLVSVGGVSQALEGASRPGHFDGVATVVLKLLNLVRPDRAYFGEKDWQQLTVVRQMVRDLNVSAQIVGVPTIRMSEGPAAGLAMSSRNSYLKEEQLARAAVLSRALRAVQAAYSAGERDVAQLLLAGREVLAGESELTLDYLSLVDEHLQPLDVLPQDLPPSADLPPLTTPGMSGSEQPQGTPNLHNAAMFRLLIAARMFGVRLIDNLPLLADTAPDLSRL